MKTLHSILTLLFSFSIVVNAQSKATGPVQFKSARLQAAGLTCAMCTKAINSSLKKVAFVKAIEPDIKSSSFLVTFRENTKVDFDAIRKAVEDAGFSIASLKVTGNFDKINVHNDAHVEIDGKALHFLNIKDQSLEGEKEITIIDKGFVTPREYKKYSAASAMACVKTSKAESCCVKKGITTNERIYHVTI